MAGKVAWRVGELAAAAEFFGLPASKLIDESIPPRAAAVKGGLL